MRQIERLACLALTALLARPAKDFFEAANPGIDAVARFENPAGPAGEREAIVIFRLK